MTIGGIVLAAGAGTRFGGPKALARDPAGIPWLHLVVRALADGGCDEVVVALGAGAEAAAGLVPDAIPREASGGEGAAPVPVSAIRVDDWAGGLSATVRAAIASPSVGSADAVVILPVDVPGVPASAVARVIASASDLRSALVQASYRGHPGHPVLIGADHIPSIAAGLVGDRGAGPYLRRNGAVAVDCADLWPGEDVDRR